METFRHSESARGEPQSHHLEEDLYFEMEFQPGEKENTPIAYGAFPSVSDISCELDTSLRDDRRGSSVGPILERPKYLRISSKL